MSDRISTFLGAPPNHWKATEAAQMKQIHRCYRNAHNVRDEEAAEAEASGVELVDVSNQDTFRLAFGNGLAATAKPGRARAPGTRDLTGNNGNSNNNSAGRTSAKADGQSAAGAPGGDPALAAGNDDAEGKRDEEWFLPRDSPLRSKDGDKKAPANSVFRDYETFQRSCEFDYWREHFEGQAPDRFLAETAETIVANICSAQARNELRVQHGKIPLRKKREHITPLALALHELKLWATNILRPSSVFEEETYKELRCRIRYLDALSHKEVWGDPAVFLAAGMSPVAHDKLFRLLLTTKEALERAQEYAYRGYCRRSSREKLARLGNLLKNVLLREMRVLSNVLTLQQKLSSPKTRRLQPTDLLNSLQNQTFVDFKNLANVLMYRLCQEPLVKAALTSNYEPEDVKAQLADLENWTARNLFCKPAMDGLNNEPEFLFDAKKDIKMMPAIYSPTALELKKALKEVDPRAILPLPAKQHVKIMVKAFESSEAAATVMKLVMKNAAAIQEVIPTLFAIHTLWGIAGDGGDFTVYDTLREQVIKVMSNTIERVYTLQSTGKILLKEIGLLCKTKEKAMEKRQLKTGKAKYKPAWVMNYKFLHTDLLPAAQKGYGDCFKQLWEIAKDAWDYNLTHDQLDDKVEAAKKMCDALTGGSKKNEKKVSENKSVTAEPVKEELPAEFKGEFKSSEVVKIAKKQDWLHSNERSGDDEFGKNNVFGDGDGAAYDKMKMEFEKDLKEEEDNRKKFGDADDDEDGGHPEKYNPFGNADDSDDY